VECRPSQNRSPGKAREAEGERRADKRKSYGVRDPFRIAAGAQRRANKRISR